jgi:hypothetical protein
MTSERHPDLRKTSFGFPQPQLRETRKFERESPGSPQLELRRIYVWRHSVLKWRGTLKRCLNLE